MNESSHLDELLASRASSTRRAIDPCTVVIFGASGDLTARKLIPALYHLAVERALPTPYRIIGFARREKTQESFRSELLEALRKYSRTRTVDESAALSVHVSCSSATPTSAGLPDRPGIAPVKHVL